METKSINITPPEGYEIDQEHSTFEKIVFKPIKKILTYEDIAKELFSKSGCYTDNHGNIVEVEEPFTLSCCDPNNAISEEQLKCILAKNKLANVARYLNGDWKPDLNADYGFVICNFSPYCYQNIQLRIEHMAVMCPYSSGQIVFKSEELAKQAIQILGEEEVKLALKPLY